MIKEQIPYLCRGTFFVLLLRSKRKSSSKKDLRIYGSDGCNNTALMTALIMMFDPKYQVLAGSSLETNTSRYKKCDIASADCLPFDDRALINSFDTSVKTDYYHELLKMQKLIETFLTIEKEAKNKELVYGLLNLIKQDETILPNYEFYALPNGKPISKSHLCALTDINLSAFLLGVWHFILVHHSDNKTGAPTIQSWHSLPSEKGDRHIFKSDICDSYDHEIKISTTCEEADDAVDAYEEADDTNDIPEPKVIEAEVVQPSVATPTPTQNIQNFFNISQTGNGINIGYAEKIEIRDGKVVKLK